MNFLKSLLCAALAVLAMLVFELGHDWLELGHGLNPMLAFPAATLLLLGSLGVHAVFDRL